MAPCRTCGEDKFELVDGHYYCTECQTQSQDLREEEAEDFATGLSHSLALHPDKKLDSSRKEKKAVDKGRPWTTSEGFQIIIQQQAKALVALGADPKLEDTVFRIWTKYLQKTGVAFTEEKQAKQLYPYHRDRFPGTVDDPYIRPIRWLRTTQKNKTVQVSRKKLKQEKEHAEYDAAFEGEEFEEEETEDTANVDQGKEDELRQRLVADMAEEDHVLDHETEVCREDEEGNVFMIKTRKERSAKRKRYLGKKQVERFSLIRTVAVNMLGLMYCNPLITTADLARWIRNGKVPYRTAVNALPSDMKLCNYDQVTFAPMGLLPPSAKQISTETLTLARYLSLDRLPSVDLAQLASRYIVELRLPGEFHGLVRKMISLQPPQLPLVGHRGSHLPEYSAIAISYIVFILKLLLGLDDHTERELSFYARNLMQLIPNAPCLFVWEEWVSFMEQKMAFIKEQQFGEDIDDIRRIADVEECMSSYHSKRKKVTVGKYTQRDKHNMYVRERSEYREKLSQPFEILLDRMKARERPLSNTDSSHHVGDQGGSSQSGECPAIPGLFSQTFSSNPMDHLLQDSDSEEEQDDDSVEKDFSGTTLRYLLDEDFLDQLDNQGLSDFTIYSSCIDDEEEEEQEEEMTHQPSGGDSQNYSQDLFLTPAVTVRKRKSNLTIRKAVHHRLKQSHRSRTKRSKISAADLQKQLVHAYENYVIYPSNPEAVVHKSYEWLLTVLSTHIECSRQTLFLSVQRTQLLHFDESAHRKHGSCHYLLKGLYLKTFFQPESNKRKRRNSEDDIEMNL